MKKSFLVLGLFLVMGFAFAAPVLNVQGKVLNNGIPVSNGTVTGYIYAYSGCTSASISDIPNPSDPVNSNGVFDLTFSSSGTWLFASNTPYYLKLVYSGSATPLVACQAFYPTQVQGGTVLPADSLATRSNVSSRFAVGNFGSDYEIPDMFYNPMLSSFSVLYGASMFGTPDNVNYAVLGGWSWFRGDVYVGVFDSHYTQPTLRVYGPSYFFNTVGIDNLLSVNSISSYTTSLPVTVSDDLNVTGAGGLTVSPGPVETNTVSPSSGNNLTVFLPTGSGRLLVRNGSTTYEVCMKNGNCDSGGLTQGEGDNRYVVKLSTYTNTQSVFGPFAVQNVFQVGTPTQSRNSTFYGDAIVDGDLITSSVWPASGNLTLGRTGNWDYPSLELVKAAGSTPRYIQLIGGIVALSDGGFLGLTLFTTLSSAQIRGRNTTNNDVPVSIMTGLSVGSASGLTVSPGPLTVGSGTSGSASVGSLAVRGTSATVNGKDVCLEDGTNCPASASAVRAVKYETAVAYASSVTDAPGCGTHAGPYGRSLYQGTRIPDSPAGDNGDEQKCWCYTTDDNQWRGFHLNCGAGFKAAGCEVLPMSMFGGEFYGEDAGGKYSGQSGWLLRELCVKTT